ncbi:MAG: hypothetical protein ABIR70_14295 [Bryobacteraceae bacterium]
MGFLDNLENTLKALERQEERDPEKVRRDQERREADRNASIQRAPHVEALRSSAFTQELLGQCRVVGREQKVLVQFTWLDENLRLDAKEKRMELVPTAEGIIAVFSQDGAEVSQEKVNPETDNAEALARKWLA